MLEEKLKCPVIIENGANSAAIAEFFYGFGKDFQNIAYFNCGIGIRTGIISSGRLMGAINDEENKLSADKRKRVIFSKPGYFKENAISVGAAAFVIERYFENII